MCLTDEMSKKHYALQRGVQKVPKKMHNNKNVKIGLVPSWVSLVVSFFNWSLCLRRVLDHLGHLLPHIGLLRLILVHVFDHLEASLGSSLNLCWLTLSLL